MDSGSFPTSGQAGRLAATPLEDSTDHSRPPLLSLFFAFQIIGGHIGFPILLAVIFALRNASSRHPLFINFCVIWIISSVVFCILLYAGYDTGPEPPFGICAIQASLVYAMPIMSSVSLWAIVFHLWLCLRGAMTQAQIARSRQRQWVLIALPYLVAIPYIIFPAVIVQKMPDRISRRQTGFGFHCSTDFKPLRTTVSISVALSLVLLLVWEFLVGWICYKNWRSVRRIRVYGWASANLFVRIAIFTLYIALGIVACMIAIAFPSNRFRILFQASLPTAAFLFFGTRPDLWRRKRDNRTVTSGTSGSARSGSSTESSNSGAALSNSFPVVQGPTPSSRQVFSFLSSTATASSAKTITPPNRSRSYSTDGDSMRQIERASTIRSKSLQSVASSATERDFWDKDAPALPRQISRQTIPKDVGPDGTIHEPGPEKGIWIAPRRGAVAWEGARKPYDAEKGVQKTEEAYGDVVDIKPIERYPQSAYDMEKGLSR